MALLGKTPYLGFNQKGGEIFALWKVEGFWGLKMNASHPEKCKQETNNPVFNFLLSLWAAQEDRVFLPIWHYVLWAREMIFSKNNNAFDYPAVASSSQTLCFLIILMYWLVARVLGGMASCSWGKNKKGQNKFLQHANISCCAWCTFQSGSFKSRPSCMSGLSLYQWIIRNVLEEEALEY